MRTYHFPCTLVERCTFEINAFVNAKCSNMKRQFEIRYEVSITTRQTLLSCALSYELLSFKII